MNNQSKPGILRGSLVALIHDEYVILQPRKQIEDGWFIKIIPPQVQLWNIPQFGGEEYLVSTHPSITDAYKHASNLY